MSNEKLWSLKRRRMRKQSKEERKKRLSEMRCPVHGIGLTQIDEDRAECPRKDCNMLFLHGERDIVAEMVDCVLTVRRVS